MLDDITSYFLFRFETFALDKFVQVLLHIQLSALVRPTFSCNCTALGTPGLSRRLWILNLKTMSETIAIADTDSDMLQVRRKATLLLAYRALNIF